MLPTKAEAQEKACPHFPATDYNPSPRCLAAGCSQWRWYDPKWERLLTAIEIDTGEPLPPHGEGWQACGRSFVASYCPGERQQWWERIDPNRRGYCGLASTPIDEELMIKRVREIRELGLRTTTA